MSEQNSKEQKNPTMEVFMEQAAFYQKGLADLILEYRKKGLDVSAMSIVHCESGEGKTRVANSIMASQADLASMLHDIEKACPGIIEKYVLIKKIGGYIEAEKLRG